jgi:hypothetical protein
MSVNACVQAAHLQADVPAISVRHDSAGGRVPVNGGAHLFEHASERHEDASIHHLGLGILKLNGVAINGDLHLLRRRTRSD